MKANPERGSDALFVEGQEHRWGPSRNRFVCFQTAYQLCLYNTKRHNLNVSTLATLVRCSPSDLCFILIWDTIFDEFR